jgi:hypothetical protein
MARQGARGGSDVTDEVPSVSEIVKQLPPSLRGRFNSLGNYVEGVVREIRGADAPRLSGRQFGVIHLIVFVYLLNRYLNEGTLAAEHAAVAASELGFESFTIGRTTFTKDNENTLLGRTLANALLASLEDSSVVGMLQRATTVRSLVRDLLFKTRLIDG